MSHYLNKEVGGGGGGGGGGGQLRTLSFLATNLLDRYSEGMS